MWLQWAPREWTAWVCGWLWNVCCRAHDDRFNNQHHVFWRVRVVSVEIGNMKRHHRGVRVVDILYGGSAGL